MTLIHGTCRLCPNPALLPAPGSGSSAGLRTVQKGPAGEVGAGQPGGSVYELWERPQFSPKHQCPIKQSPRGHAGARERLARDLAAPLTGTRRSRAQSRGGRSGRPGPQEQTHSVCLWFPRPDSPGGSSLGTPPPTSLPGPPGRTDPAPQASVGPSESVWLKRRAFQQMTVKNNSGRLA